MDEQAIAKPEAPQGWGLQAERDAIAARRAVVYAGEQAPEYTWGLALSGGGIRSATFCLGVLQALAKAPFKLPGENSPLPGSTDASTPLKPTTPPTPPTPSKTPWPLLARFDFLSTVSGGGYTGGFFSALFRSREPSEPVSDAAAAAAAKEAYAALATDPPGRLSKVRDPSTAVPGDTHDRPLRWLRENGRYLAPNNAGDLLYDVAIAIRNLCAVHYVIGVTLLALFLLMFALRFAGLHIPCEPLQHAAVMLESRMQPQLSPWRGDIWYSPWFGILGCWLIAAVVPCGVAYWLDRDRTRARPRKPAAAAGEASRTKTLVRSLPVPAVAAAVLLALGIAAACFLRPHGAGQGAAWMAWLPTAPGPVMVLVLMDVALFVSLLVFAAAKYCPPYRSPYPYSLPMEPRLFRNRITRWLSRVLAVSLAIGLLALVETAGQTLYLWLVMNPSAPATLCSVAGAVAALVAVVRKFAPLLAQPGKDGWLGKLPLNAILGAVGLALVLLLAVAWSCAAAALLFGMQAPAPGAGQLLVEAMFTQAGSSLGFAGMQRYAYPAVLMAFCLAATVAAGYFLGFVNLSSLQVMYGARLTRAYLGASNKKRFDPEAPRMDVTEADPSDDFSREDYYGRKHLGPAHLINITINATTGTGDQLTQRDRQGLPLAVTPAGITVDGKPWDCDCGNFAGAQPPAKPLRWPPPELSIGQWMGVSGAAFSTGLGRGTSLGQAMLFTVTNIRLGWWWNSGKKDARKLSPLWRNQAYLQRELRARFLGTDGSHWYLSDGGHFENTAVFELLRRRAGFIVCCDCGADPGYGFADLSNLMRLARIEFRAEFACVPPAVFPGFTPDAARLEPYFALDEAELGPPAGPQGKLPIAPDDKCALLYRVRYAGAPGQESFLLVLKPRLIKSAPLDLFGYQVKNPSFPQQTTFDQFFDEAQWESYRKLGALIGSRIFQ